MKKSMTLLDPYDPAVRLSIAKYRCSKAYPSFEESPFADRFAGFEHSDLIDGNCLVVKRELPLFGIHYITFLADPLGNITSIKASFDHSESLQEAIAWAESEEFWLNKEKYVAQSDSPLFVFPADEESSPAIKERHLRFSQGYAAFCKGRTHDHDSEGLAP